MNIAVAVRVGFVARVGLVARFVFVVSATWSAGVALAGWSGSLDENSVQKAGGRVVGKLQSQQVDGTRFVLLGRAATVVLPTSGLFNPRRGTVRFRVRPTWDGDDHQAHAFFHLGDSHAHVTVFKTDTGKLRFAYKASPERYLACDLDVSNWKAGQTHSVFAGWVPTYSGHLLLVLKVDDKQTLRSGATVLSRVPPVLFVGRRGLKAQPAEAWIADFQLTQSAPAVPYATGPKHDVVARVDCSRTRPLRRVHDFTTIWNSRDNPVPFAPGDPVFQRFVDAGFHLVRLVAFSETWLWGTRVEVNSQGQLVTDFRDFDRLADVFSKAGAELYVRLAYHTPSALVDPSLPRQKRRYAMPRDLKLWDQLMERIVRHVRLERKLPVRYWVAALNEGDLPVRRGQAEPETVYRLYERTARLVKRLDPTARVGGPALAFSTDADGRPAAMLLEFLRYCRDRHVPLDFVCFHGYRKAHPRDYEQLTQTVRSAVRSVWPEKAARLEYFLDEWNLWLRDGRQDNEYAAAYLAAGLHYQRRAGLTKSSIVSFNHFRWPRPFVYNDQTIARLTGLPLIKGSVVTTPYFVWLMHNRLAEREAAVTLPGRDGILKDDTGGLTATVDRDRVALLLWHFDLLRGEPRKWTVQVERLPQPFAQATAVQLTEYRIDHDHNNPYTDYVLKGQPTHDGRYNLRSAKLTPLRRQRLSVVDGRVTLEVELPDMSVSLVELVPVR